MPKPKKENFTAGRIASYAFIPSGTGKSNQTLYWDAKTPGLGLRVTSSGARSYVFESKLHGHSIRLTIGDTKTWSVADAQKMATQYKAQVDQGIDPRQVFKDQRASVEAEIEKTKRLETNFETAWRSYMAVKKAKWSVRHYADHDKVIQSIGTPGPLACFCDKKLGEITADTVKAWLDDPTQNSRPTYTSIAFRKLRAFLNWASDQPEYAEAVAADACSRKVAKDRVATTKAKDDCLQREQLKPWFDEVRKLSSTVVASYLQCLLLTGARREEMATLRWEYVDFRWKTITIKDKVEEVRTIPLTPYVEKLLLDLDSLNRTPPPEYRILHGKRIRNNLDKWRPSEWVFFSKTADSGRIVEPRIGHNRAIATAGLPPLTLHGLRRSFGTLAEWVECPVGISAQIMGHKPSALAEKHYRKRPLDLLRMWHTKIESWILNNAGIPMEQLS